MDPDGTEGLEAGADPHRTPDFHRLVDRTRGLQPWRRIFHAVNGTIVAALLVSWEPSRGTAAVVLGAGAVAQRAADVARLVHPPANALFFRAFRSLASPREASGLASSTWYAIGMALTVLLFPLESAVSGILVLALADPAGSYVGRRWGKRPVLGGTVAGTTAFVLVAGAVLLLRHGPAVAAVGSLAAMLAERRSWPLDDNLAVPLVTAAVVSATGILL